MPAPAKKISPEFANLLVNQHDGPYTDREIAPVLRDMLGRSFRGVLMGDQPVPATRPGDTFLVNLDSAGPTGKGGTHWATLRHSVQRPHSMIWIDSLGLMPPKPITHSVRRTGRTIVANDGAEQDIRMAEDALCGPRAVLFARRMAESPKKDFQTFLDLAADG